MDIRILPVLDVMNGEVVRGVAGRRHEYRPVVSRLTSSTRPVDVARALHAHFGLSEFYLADLDAIAGMPPALVTYAALQREGFRLRVDAGVQGLGQARRLANAGVAVIVAGLETLAGPQALAEIARDYGDRVVFSLDLREGVPLGDTTAWERPVPLSIAAQAVARGVRRLLVLDLARVGTGGGLGTEELCRRLAAAFPQVELSAGGGVRGPADLRRLRACGVQAALVASALHDGRLTREDLAGL